MRNLALRRSLTWLGALVLPVVLAVAPIGAPVALAQSHGGGWGGGGGGGGHWGGGGWGGQQGGHWGGQQGGHWNGHGGWNHGHGYYGGPHTSYFFGFGGPAFWGWPYDGWPAYGYAYPAPAYVSPPTVVVPQTPGPPPAASWYYCDNPAGYYPYVSTCSTPFRPVPAQPR